MIYFDNAATTFPKPLVVKNAVDTALTRYGANPGRGGHDLSVETAKQYLKCAPRSQVFSARRTLRTWCSHRIVPMRSIQ